eukprot:scaffold2499_cov125-Cylindrotheca_fusiformis.AAC.33
MGNCRSRDDAAITFHRKSSSSEVSQDGLQHQLDFASTTVDENHDDWFCAPAKVNGVKMAMDKAEEKSAERDLYTLLQEARTLDREGKHDEAIDMYKKVLAIQKTKLRDDESYLIAMTYSSMASVRLKQEKIAEAMKFYESMVDILKRTRYLNSMIFVSDKCTHIAEKCDRLSTKLQKNIHPGKARIMDLYRRKLIIEEEILGSQHAMVYSTCECISDRVNRLANALEEPDEIIDLFQQELTLYKDVFGDQHRAVAKAYRKLANALRDQNKLNESLGVLSEELAVRRLSLSDEENDSISTAYKSMAAIRLEQGQLDDAMDCYQQQLNSDRRSSVDKNSALVAETYHNMGKALEQSGNLTEALEFYKQELAIAEEDRQGNEVVHSTRPHECIARVLEAQNRLDDAMQMYQRIARIQEEAFGKCHSLLGKTYNAMGSILQKQGEGEEAQAMFQKATQF